MQFPLKTESSHQIWVNDAATSYHMGTGTRQSVQSELRIKGATPEGLLISRGPDKEQVEQISLGSSCISGEMTFGAWTVTVLLFCLASGGQANKGSVHVELTSKFLNLSESSSITSNLRAANASLNVLANSIKGLKTPGQTKDLEASIEMLRPFARESSELGFLLTSALTNLIRDPTIPITVRFEQVERVPKEFLKFISREWTTTLKELIKSFGCVRVDDFVFALQRAYYKALEIIGNVDQIGKIVLNADHFRGGHSDNDKVVAPAQLKSLVGTLDLNVKDFNDTVSALAEVFKSAVDGVERANRFLLVLNSHADITSNEMDTAAAQVGETASNHAKNVQNKYSAAQLSIKTSLTNTLTGLSIFSGSKKLNHLVKESQTFYGKLYQFLRRQKHSDLEEIEEYLSNLGRSTERSIRQTADVFIKAVSRTGLRLADVVLEGGSHADACYASYSKTFAAPFKSLSSFVSRCIRRETRRWSSISSTFDDMLDLALMNSQELSTNLGRCSSMYTNFAMSSEDFVRAKACLSTNIEDLEDLPEILAPLFRNVNQLIRREVRASMFRVENCLATNLQEDLEGFKYTRSAIEICAGMPKPLIDECRRSRRDDDEHEMRHRERDRKEKDDDNCKNVHPEFQQLANE